MDNNKEISLKITFLTNELRLSQNTVYRLRDNRRNLRDSDTFDI